LVFLLKQGINMSEETGDQGGKQDDDLQVDELALLKQRATLLGVSFSNNIGLETLKERIQAKQAELEGGPAAVTAAPVAAKTMPVPGAAEAPVKQLTLRQYIHAKSMKLVRLRIVNLDPKKKDLPGEFLTVANEHLGTVTKFIPFGEVTDNGYHVPYCLYKMMKNRKFLNIRTYKDKKNDNQIRVEQRWANEFALEVLDPLTPQQLAELAAAQTAAGNMG